MLQLAAGLVQVENIVFPTMYLFLTALAMLLGASWAGLSGAAEKICLMLSITHLAAALLSVVMQAVQVAGVDMAPFIMTIVRQTFLRPFANVAQPNQLALLLCFGFWLLAWHRSGGCIRRGAWGAWLECCSCWFCCAERA